MTTLKYNSENVTKAFLYVQNEQRLRINEMAEKLDISRVSLSNILSKGYNPRLDLLIHFIEVFNLNPVWVLSGDGNPYGVKVDTSKPESFKNEKESLLTLIKTKDMLIDSLMESNRLLKKQAGIK